jgi:hypothetical protein
MRTFEVNMRIAPAKAIAFEDAVSYAEIARVALCPPELRGTEWVYASKTSVGDWWGAWWTVEVSVIPSTFADLDFVRASARWDALWVGDVVDRTSTVAVRLMPGVVWGLNSLIFGRSAPRTLLRKAAGMLLVR